MKIIVSLTTIPDRLENGFPYKNVKDFYDNQLVKPDMVIINIPVISSKGIKYNKDKADEFKKIGENIIVNWGVEDMGPITKLIPTLEYLKKVNITDAYIILIDDDCIYNNDLIEDLKEMKKNNPEKMAIGYEGFIYSMFVPIRQSNSNVSNFIECDALETYAGVLYDSKLFLPYEEFKKFAINLPDYVKKADDMIIGAWIRKNGGKLYRANSDGRVKHDAHDTTQLRDTNLTSGNVKSMNYFAHKQHYGPKCMIVQYSCISMLSLLMILILIFICIKIKPH
jgi:hypothetical protein